MDSEKDTASLIGLLLVYRSFNPEVKVPVNVRLGEMFVFRVRSISRVETVQICSTHLSKLAPKPSTQNRLDTYQITKRKPWSVPEQ